MAGRVFIPDDGFTFTDQIPEVSGLYPAVEYDYRPAVQRERFEFQSAPDAAERARRAASILSRHVTEMRAEGQTFKLTEDQAAKLMPGIFAHVLDRVLGYAGPAEASVKN